MLRDFQADMEQRTYNAWDSGAQYVMDVMATGGGKTVLFCHIAVQRNVPTRVIAHRQELVTQISCTLNRERVPHAIRAPKDVIKEITRAHIDLYGHSYYKPNSIIKVESVDTSNARGGEKGDENVQLVIVDEGHHVLAGNKWGKAVQRYTRAKGLFVTAHAVRADGAGLGRQADGLVDALVVGPCGRDLIRRGFLCDYRVACPESDIDYDKVEISSATGDYNAVKLRAEVHKSGGLVGSVVQHYLELAPGKLGITFAVDLAEAARLQRAYSAAAVRSAVISADTPTHIRTGLIRSFRARELLQLISVDVLGEGVDVPAVEVVLMARPTASWQTYCQQKGRLDRVSVAPEYAQHWHLYSDQQRLEIIAASQKPYGIWIDCVGNLARHAVHRGLPDSPQQYDLGKRPRGLREGAGDQIPLYVCPPPCMKPYEAWMSKCPYCKRERPPSTGRGAVTQLNGKLVLLDPAELDSTYRRIAEIDGPAPAHGHTIAAASIRKQHRIRQDAQGALRPLIAMWAGWQREQGRDDNEARLLFLHRYKTHIETAMTLPTCEALRLQARLMDDLQNVRVKT